MRRRDFAIGLFPAAAALCMRVQGRPKQLQSATVSLAAKVTTMCSSSVARIVMLIVSLLAAPLAANAQPSGKVPTIGYLSVAGGAPGGAPLAESFRRGLEDLGYIEGANIRFEHRYAEGRFERFAKLATELVSLKVDVIVTSVVVRANEIIQ